MVLKSEKTNGKKCVSINKLVQKVNEWKNICKRYIDSRNEKHKKKKTN